MIFTSVTIFITTPTTIELNRSFARSVQELHNLTDMAEFLKEVGTIGLPFHIFDIKILNITIVFSTVVSTCFV